MRLWDVAALGEALVEFNQTQSEPPLYLQGFGGDTSNAAIAAARAGAKVRYLTRLGTDRWGDGLLGLWQSEQVDTMAIQRDASAPTGIYFVSHDAQGHHFSYARAGSAASRMQVQDLQHWADTIAQSRWLHVSGISLAISASACDTVLAAMQHARQAGTLVALDSNLRLSLWPLARAQACIRQAMSLCHVFLPSWDDLNALTGLTQPEEIIAWCHAQGAPQVVLKMGAQGAIISEGGIQTILAGHQVTAVDATGAGDCFAGNLLARLCAGDSLGVAATYANAAAGLSVQGYGAVAPMPRPAAVMEVLNP
jgi:2-dehydro-3-deoxygluconokinase